MFLVPLLLSIFCWAEKFWLLLPFIDVFLISHGCLFGVFDVLMDVCFSFSCMFAFRFSMLYILSYRINVIVVCFMFFLPYWFFPLCFCFLSDFPACKVVHEKTSSRRVSFFVLYFILCMFVLALPLIVSGRHSFPFTRWCRKKHLYTI